MSTINLLRVVHHFISARLSFGVCRLRFFLLLLLLDVLEAAAVPMFALMFCVRNIASLLVDWKYSRRPASFSSAVAFVDDRRISLRLCQAAHLRVKALLYSEMMLMGS